MQHILTATFFLRKSRKDKRNQVPIIIRLKLHNTVRDISTGLRIDPANWNSEKHLVRGRNDFTNNLNSILESIKTKYFQIFASLSQTGDFTLDDIIDCFNGKQASKDISLLKLVSEHNNSIKRRIDIDYTESTYEKYLAMEVRINQFVRNHLKKSDVFIRKLDRKFISDFFLYLKEVHKNQHNSATKTTKNLKRVLSYAVEQGYIDKNPFTGFQCGYKETHKTILTLEELNRIAKKQFSIPRLELVKNLFLFQCYTGLSYVDMAKLTWKNVIVAEGNIFWLEITRTKTAQSTQIPLFPVALEIIRKYDSGQIHQQDDPLLPVYEIQKTNSYLKEIADICGITKKLSTHAGRRTFASTVMLNNGVRIEAVSRMLAHSSIRTTQLYAKVYDQYLIEQTQKIKWLWDNETDKQ